MQPPAKLIKAGVTELPCVGDGRQSGTSGSPSILNASPEAASNGGLAIVKTNDMVRIDLNKRTANVLISKEEYNKRLAALRKKGGFAIPESQTPWQEIQRGIVERVVGRHDAQAGGEVPAHLHDQGRAEGQSLTA